MSRDETGGAWVVGRICLRRLPAMFGFTWWQFSMTPFKWNRDHYWAVRNIARAHRIGPFWICTMRKDCVERWAARKA